MSSLLVRGIHALACFDDERRELSDASIYVRDNVIVAVGGAEDMPSPDADRIIDARNHVVVPGLVNTHHHMFQTLTRVMAQDASLFDWLRTLYPIWARMEPEDIRVATRTAMTELLLSGCTTTSDHLYLYPNGIRLDDSVEAAAEVGMRFHATRGAMSLGESDGGLPPDALVEDEDAILADMQRVIEAFHDPGRFAMTRVALAPCSPFSVTPDLMRNTASLARSCGVGLHTHLAENDSDVAYSRERFGCRPGEFAECVGWVGSDVWHAHCVKLDGAEMTLLGATRTGACHCPSSNMRLGSGRAPLRAMIDAGMRVGLGVDGSASNDGSNMLTETRQAWLLARLCDAPAALSARDALALATRGGAAVLGRDDIGAIAPGMAADLAGFRRDGIGFAGAAHDPVAALVLCDTPRADFVVVDGKLRIDGGRPVDFEIAPLVEQHNRRARRLMGG